MNVKNNVIKGIKVVIILLVCPAVSLPADGVCACAILPERNVSPVAIMGNIQRTEATLKLGISTRFIPKKDVFRSPLFTAT